MSHRIRKSPRYCLSCGSAAISLGAKAPLSPVPIPRPAPVTTPPAICIASLSTLSVSLLWCPASASSAALAIAYTGVLSKSTALPQRVCLRAGASPLLLRPALSRVEIGALFHSELARIFIAAWERPTRFRTCDKSGWAENIFPKSIGLYPSSIISQSS